ncbi:MAG TPA: CHAT domain-containing protein [Thermoanaerobaculia bacterium]|nr:CHAT domain-containing protein [Thermoanaerobaculia bacterium]
MRAQALLILGLVFPFPSGSSPEASGPRPPEPVAIVYSLAGEAVLSAPGTARRPLRPFERLPAGAVVEAGPGSRVALVFANGRRYELGERSRAALGRADLSSRVGTVRALSRVPPFPILAPITAKDRPGSRAGAVRIRGEKGDPAEKEVPLSGEVARARERLHKSVFPVDGESRALLEAVDHALGLKAEALPQPPAAAESAAPEPDVIESLQKELELERKTAPKSLAVAKKLNSLGVALARKGDYAAAAELLQQAFAMRQELAPGSSEATGTLINLGALARLRGDLEAAERYLKQGEEIQRRLNPESTDRALFFQNLGNVALDRSDLGKAEALYRQALAIFEKAAPGGMGVSDCLYNLGSLALMRGDLAGADDLFRRSLALLEGKKPEESGISLSLVNLGNLAARRGDFEAAEAFHRQALAIEEELAPESETIGHALSNLGELAYKQGDFSTARKHLQRALAIWERMAPGSPRVATALQQLGRLETHGGDLEAAEGLLRQAQAIFTKSAPEGLEIAEVFEALGEASTRRGRSEEAIAFHRHSLDLQHRLAPESSGEAEALYLLGRAERRAGRTGDGVRHLCQAIEVLDGQRARLGGTPEDRTFFEASVATYYHACLEGLIELGRPAEAFHVLERGRARSFLALLAERDLRFADLPPELAAERRQIHAAYDGVQAQLSRLSAGRDDAEIERLTGELRELRTRQEEILARMRRASPRSAALQDPQPLDLAGARAALDPGTVLLAYAVGEEKTWLFAVQPAGVSGPGLAVFPVDAGARTLREEVERFRRLLGNPKSDAEALREQAQKLYGRLLLPAGAEIERAERILLSVDGPLHTLPFAALQRGDRYLVEHRPVHSVLSATVYAEMTKSRSARRKPEEIRLTAFGNPVYQPATEAPADPELREAVRRGLDLLPLPSSSREVKSIAALYPGARVFLGSDATEEKAKTLGPESSLVHFACHGLLDERFPLNSALALTLPRDPAPGRDNGLLQAWEIFESVRLDADLVTLSACDTALGREMGGEGLVGLTRAFQYAGARSVLASLWSVSDLSTARLMKSFYGYLQSGKPKDEALRAAQIDQIRSGTGGSHPFHWAAFQLFGDWR